MPNTHVAPSPTRSEQPVPLSILVGQGGKPNVRPSVGPGTSEDLNRDLNQDIGQNDPAISRLMLHRAKSNDLLAGLRHAKFDSWFQHLEMVELNAGKTLFDCGVTVEHVYFPTTAIVSLLYVSSDGATTEVALVGHEGMVGMWWGVGERALCRAVVQTSGQAFRLKSQYLREAVSRGGALPQLLLCYTNALFAEVAHNAIGGRRSSIVQTLSRWLLERVERSIVNELKITHEEIAAMLGVRRESITEAMGKLQSNGTLHCRRGVVAVLDRSSLEQSAGKRYRYRFQPIAPESMVAEV